MGKFDALDKIFSEYIRRRDADPKSGIGRCISCGTNVHWKDGDCSHYIPRQHLSTRFDERNCNLSCPDCNEFNYGRISGYEKGLIQKYGNDIIEELNSLKLMPVKIRQSDIDELIQTYKKKTKEL